ncbi:DUF7677 family protein [Streptomyces sp. NBC_01237]|uniref:DUF7677 family protein n=1 Tax=Streptomyces sp. NBC_01237 TaxID=2903790 RepID=UPI002DD95108|nr:hypothetical protein [Streptomyces sp. NBC_01237]WRZ77215.1 hypothetical protein OG251_36750 [Streptomyces sp. NBC_01237]
MNPSTSRTVSPPTDTDWRADGVNEIQQLPPGLRSDLRYFAYYLGNGTLLCPVYDELDYDEVITRYDDTVGRLFAILLDSYDRPLDDDKVDSFADYDRVRAWLAAECDQARYKAPALSDAELRLSDFDEKWKDAVVAFACKLGSGTLAPKVLKGIDYVPYLVEGGSLPEDVVMVFANVLRVTSDGTPTNAGHAEHRAAQKLREWLEPGYQPDPPMEIWEFNLV